MLLDAYLTVSVLMNLVECLDMMVNAGELWLYIQLESCDRDDFHRKSQREQRHESYMHVKSNSSNFG